MEKRARSSRLFLALVLVNDLSAWRARSLCLVAASNVAAIPPERLTASRIIVSAEASLFFKRCSDQRSVAFCAVSDYMNKW